MKYLLMIHDDEESSQDNNPDEFQDIRGRYSSFTKMLEISGQMLGGERLQPSSTAKSVQVRDGKTITTDGPYIETKEQLGGFYMIEARDLDVAIKIASQIPSAKTGHIEVRPIWTE